MSTRITYPATAFAIVLSLLIIFSISSVNPANAKTHFTINKNLTDTIPLVDSNQLKVFEKVEIEASFPGGESGWRSYLEHNLNANTPVDHGAPAGSYTVWVQFIVDKEGQTSAFKALTNHGYGMEAEVIRIIKKSPPWTPATQDGRMVKAYRKQPVTFVVIDDTKKGRRKRG